MKKIISYIIAYALLTLGLPYLIATPKKVESASEKIRVLNSSDGKIFETDLEEYLFGVIAGEMPASFNIEALKAQAVAARTFIINRKENPSADHPDAVVCNDSTHCKAWLSNEEISEKFGDEWQKNYSKKIRDAVSSTNGEIIEYNGEPIVAVFHSTGSGKTENSGDVWSENLPYLKSVDSPGDNTSPKFYSNVTVSKQDAEKILGVPLFIGNVIHTDGGSVKTMEISGKTFSGTEMRSLFGLNSANFTISENDNSITFNVTGHGHGVGMSQYGANSLAENGMNYKDILKTYYSGVDIIKK